MRKIIKPILILLFIGTISCSEQKRDELDYHKILETFINTCWNQKDLSKLNNVVDEDYIRYVNNIQIISNRKELEANMHVVFTGFPDFKAIIDNTLIIQNIMIINWTFTGTNTGVYGEIIATGKKVKFSGITKIIFDKNKKIIQENVYYNDLDLLQQLGYSLIPPNVE